MYTMQEVLEAAERARAATVINNGEHGSFNCGAECAITNFISEMIALSTRQIIESIAVLDKAFEKEAV